MVVQMIPSHTDTLPLFSLSYHNRNLELTLASLSLLLLDEPLSGVDSASSEKIIELLKTIAKDNSMTILMTLHQVRFEF